MKKLSQLSESAMARSVKSFRVYEMSEHCGGFYYHYHETVGFDFISLAHWREQECLLEFAGCQLMCYIHVSNLRYVNGLQTTLVRTHNTRSVLYECRKTLEIVS